MARAVAHRPRWVLSWAAVVALAVSLPGSTACKNRNRGAELHAPSDAPAWEGRFGVAFDNGYTREPINLDGRAPHDVLDQRLFAARMGHAAIVAVVQVDQVWGKGRYQGRQDQFLGVEIQRLLIGELPRGVTDEQMLRIAGDEELPGTLQGVEMLLFVRWAPGEQPEYRHHLMPAEPELLRYVEALVEHAQHEGVLDDAGRIRKRPVRKKARGRAEKRAAEGDADDDDGPPE